MISLLIHPERRRPNPPALRVDLRPVILVGMSLWAVALLVSVVLVVLDRATFELPATCAAGIVLGIIGLGWERRNRSEYRSRDDESAEFPPENPA
ncbi:DUF2530 domain-containing protein [Oerskovia jenensis]|uniref:DUF2530 domain-containing protein n=1 Tax=Oerskovia jenensis TaxID=162169 RepID=UPI0036DBB210